MNTSPEATIEGQVALVTGGGRRIGAAIVRALHAAGWNLAVHCNHSVTAAQELVDELNGMRDGSAACFVADLRQTAALPDLAASVFSRWGRLDALVNNASTYFPTPFMQLEEAALEELFGTNVKAPLFLLKACLPWFGDSAVVVNILDTLARHARPGYSAYSIAKAALWSATETLAAELAPRLRVNGVAPGHILWAEATQLNNQQHQKELLRVPMQRLGQPAEVATAVVFLLSPQASYLTGVVLPVDGGLRLD